MRLLTPILTLAAAVAAGPAIAAAFGDIFAAFGEEADLNIRLLATNSDHGVISDVASFHDVFWPTIDRWAKDAVRR